MVTFARRSPVGPQPQVAPVLQVQRSPQLSVLQQRPVVVLQQRSPALGAQRSPALAAARSPMLAPASAAVYRTAAVSSASRPGIISSPVTYVLQASPKVLVTSPQPSKSEVPAPSLQEEEFILPPPVVGLEDGAEADEWAEGSEEELDAEERPDLGQDRNLVRSPLGTHYVSASKQFDLDYPYAIWFDSAQHTKRRGQSEKQYEAGLQSIGKFNSVQEFWRYWNAMDLERMAQFCSLSVFRKSIKPMWEDEDNSGGGQWLLKCTNHRRAADLFTKLTLSLIGGYFDCHDDLCGVVLTTKQKFSSIGLWMKKADPEVHEHLGGELRELLASLSVKTDADVTVEYKEHGGAAATQLKATESQVKPVKRLEKEVEKQDTPLSEVTKPATDAPPNLSPSAQAWYPQAEEGTSSSSSAAQPQKDEIVSQDGSKKAEKSQGAVLKVAGIKVSAAAEAAANAAEKRAAKNGYGQYAAYQSYAYAGNGYTADGYHQSYANYNGYAYYGSEYSQPVYYDSYGQMQNYSSDRQQPAKQTEQTEQKE